MIPPRLLRRPIARILLAVLLLAPMPATGTPGAATWYRETLLGESGSHAFVLATWMVNEGTYYRAREAQKVLRIDKRTGVIVDSVLVRSAEFRSDPDTYAPSVREEGPPTFDLAAYLRAHGTHAPYAEDSESLAEFDSTGLYLEVEDRREVLVPTAAIRARFLPSGEPDAIEFLGAEFTMARPDSGLSRMTYYRLRSYPAGSDISSSEVLIMVPDSQVEAVLRRLGAPPDPR